MFVEFCDPASPFSFMMHKIEGEKNKLSRIVQKKLQIMGNLKKW